MCLSEHSCPLKHCCFTRGFLIEVIFDGGDRDVCLELNSLLSADAGGKGMFDLGHLSHEIGGCD